jgi:hypothetical protein
MADLLRVVGTGGFAKVDGANVDMGIVEENIFLKSVVTLKVGGATGDIGIAE